MAATIHNSEIVRAPIWQWNHITKGTLVEWASSVSDWKQWWFL